MRIPSGDLAPARRRRRGGRRRALPVLLVVVLVVAVAAGAALLRRRTSAPDPIAAPAACPSPTASAAAVPAAAPPAAAAPVRPRQLPRPDQVELRLFNGTDHNGLAMRVGDQLARSFRVAKTGNPPKPLDGPARVYYGRNALPAAWLLAAQVQGAQVVALPAKEPADRLDLVLGSQFRRLATPAEASAALRAPAAPTSSRSPAASGSPSASAAPAGCR